VSTKRRSIYLEIDRESHRQGGVVDGWWCGHSGRHGSKHGAGAGVRTAAGGDGDRRKVMGACAREKGGEKRKRKTQVWFLKSNKNVGQDKTDVLKFKYAGWNKNYRI
jgi:hypothetical protein